MMKEVVQVVSAACITMVLLLVLAAMPAGEPARRVLDAGGQLLGWIPEPQVPVGPVVGSYWTGERSRVLGNRALVGTAPSPGEQSVIEFSRMLGQALERRKGRYGILPFGASFSGAASPGGKSGASQAPSIREGGLGMAGSAWAIVSLGALMLMTRRRV